MSLLIWSCEIPSAADPPPVKAISPPPPPHFCQSKPPPPFTRLTGFCGAGDYLVPSTPQELSSDTGSSIYCSRSQPKRYWKTFPQLVPLPIAWFAMELRANQSLATFWRRWTWVLHLMVGSHMGWTDWSCCQLAPIPSGMS